LFEDQTFDLVICHNFLHQLPDPVVALREIRRVAKPHGAILVRDVRRLPEPAMSLLLPLWCLGYSDKLREQTVASFRAALTFGECRQRVATAGLERTTIRTHMLTHQGVQRLAVPYAPPPPGPTPRYPLPVRALKARYMSAPARE